MLPTLGHKVVSALGLPSKLRHSDPRIKVAVLDGNVDIHHNSLMGATLEIHSSSAYAPSDARDPMSYHGTHVTSLLFGQPGTEVQGIVPHCQGLIIPVFPAQTNAKKGKATQLDLARAIETAVMGGAHIINLSGGELTDDGEANGWLQKALATCEAHNVLLVAATGNNGCACLHVPAGVASPSVLAVGAMDDAGTPLDFSNWGGTYARQGILAPGKDIPGAQPGGGTVTMSGTSFASPIVAGVAALMLSYQIKKGLTPNPQQVREYLLAGASPCSPDAQKAQTKAQCLVGKLNALQAFSLLIQDLLPQETIAVSTCPGTKPGTPPCGCQAPSPTYPATDTPEHTAHTMNTTNTLPAMGAESPVQASGVTEATPMQNVFTIGTIGYDFGTEARRDSFTQLMPMGKNNPHNPGHITEYLSENLSETSALTWVVYMELTPVYALQPVGPFSRDTYQKLLEVLQGQLQSASEESFIEKVSIPGVLNGEHIKLFSGQMVPVMELHSPRGLFGWQTNRLVTEALRAVESTNKKDDTHETRLQQILQGFMNRVFYDLRNLGVTASDRALNFAVTHAFQVASAYSDALAKGMELDNVWVEKSPMGRMDSDSWDVKLKFFDPENNKRAKRIYRFTVDVSDIIPVMVGTVRNWTSAD